MPIAIVAHRPAMLLILSAAALAPNDLAPTGKWVVDYADHQCVASRSFGAAKAPVLFVIKPSPTSDVLQLVLIKDGGPTDAIQQDAQLAFEGSAPIDVTQLRYSIKSKGFRLINLTGEQASKLRASSSIEWRSQGTDHKLQTGPLDQLIKTLAHCREDLRSYWNIAPEKAAKLQSGARPKKSLVRYFSTDDYPAQAISNQEGGMTSVVALIDEKGQIRDCMVDGTSGIATLDAMTCIVIREKGKFDPALDKDGKATRSSFMRRVRWEIPQ